MQPTVFCFGEPMLRIMPDAQSSAATIYKGGAELNVAAGLARWNFPVEYVSAMPDNALANQFIGLMNGNGIATSHMLRTGDRLGTYYLMGGTDLRNQVVYDRKYSSFGMLKTGQFNWNDILEENGWLHLTTINPSLSDELMEVCIELTAAAQAKNMRISIDLNFRPALWKDRTIPVEKFRQLVKPVHLLFGNIWSAEQLLGIPVKAQIQADSGIDETVEAAAHCSAELEKLIPSLRYTAFSFRFTEQLPGKYMATIHSGGDYAVSQIHFIDEIVDKVGSGDSCMAGLIAGCIRENELQEIIDFAAAAAVSKLGQPGDWNLWSAEQIEKLITKVV